MNIGRFQKIGTIDTSFQCDLCPIVIRKGTILHDRSRDLNLLTLTVSNLGNVTVDEIEVKVISYDKNGNAIPEENGIPGQICSLTDSGCLPDQTVGDGQLIVLPSSDAVTCDVFVTRVRTAGDVEMHFTEDDYALAATELPAIEFSPARNKRIFIGMMIALGFAVVLYLSILIGGWYTETYTIPQNREKNLTQLLEKHEYDAALRLIAKMEDDGERKEEIVQDAIAHYMSLSDYNTALRFAEKSEESDMRYRTLCDIVDLLAADGDFDAALRFAATQNSKRLVTTVYENAIAYFTERFDFRTALTWVALSGIEGKGMEVWLAAVEHYKTAGDPVTALEYAIKTQDEAVILSVYDDAVSALLERRDYETAALYIARCRLADTDVVTADLKTQIYEKTSATYVRIHIADFWASLSFAQKQQLYAKTIAIDDAVLAIRADGGLYGTGSSLPSAMGAVSIDVSSGHIALLMPDGTVITSGSDESRQCQTQNWTAAVGVAVGEKHTVALLDNGKVIATGSNQYGQCDVSAWTDIVQIDCGPYYTVGLKRDGSVVATGRNNAGQCDTAGWNDIILLSAGENHTLALRTGGGVLAAGVRAAAKCDVSDWSNVVSLAAGSNHSAAVTADGKLLIAGGSLIGISAIPEWDDVIAIAAGEDSILILRENRLECIGQGKIKVDSAAPLKR